MSAPDRRGHLRFTELNGWVLSCLTAPYRKPGGPCWRFRHRHLAIQFAERRGISIHWEGL